MPPDAIEDGSGQAGPEGQAQANPPAEGSAPDGVDASAGGDGDARPEGSQAVVSGSPAEASEGTDGPESGDALAFLGEADDETVGRLFEHPRMEERLRDLREVAENAGAQRREHQLRTEAGSRERTSAAVARQLQEEGTDPERVGESGVKHREFTYALAEANVTDVVLREIAEAVTKSPSFSDAERATFEAGLGETTDLGKVNEFASRLWSTGVERERADARATMRISDVPETGHPLRSDIDELVQKRVEDELKAHDLETRGGPSGVPRTPNGQAPGGSPDRSTKRGIFRAVGAGELDEPEAERLLAALES